MEKLSLPILVLGLEKIVLVYFLVVSEPDKQIKEPQHFLDEYMEHLFQWRVGAEYSLSNLFYYVLAGVHFHRYYYSFIFYIQLAITELIIISKHYA